ncbi:hypothetical protein TeGR_g3409, partial [Tetraparma gracilis]
MGKERWRRFVPAAKILKKRRRPKVAHKDKKGGGSRPPLAPYTGGNNNNNNNNVTTVQSVTKLHTTFTETTTTSTVETKKQQKSHKVLNFRHSSHARSLMRSRPDGSAYSGLGRGPPPTGVIVTSVANAVVRGRVLKFLKIKACHLSTPDSTLLVDVCDSMLADLGRAPDRVCSVDGLGIMYDALECYKAGTLSVENLRVAAAVLFKACSVLDTRVGHRNDTLEKLNGLSTAKVGELEGIFEQMSTSVRVPNVQLLKDLTVDIVGYGIFTPNNFDSIAWDGTCVIMALDRPVDGTAKDQEKTPTLKAIIHFATEVAKCPVVYINTALSVPVDKMVIYLDKNSKPRLRKNKSIPKAEFATDGQRRIFDKMQDDAVRNCMAMVSSAKMALTRDYRDKDIKFLLFAHGHAALQSIDALPFLSDWERFAKGGCV